jgi:acyl-CoA synthetase (AMP-forming)/AMP-acid ligase II
MNIRSPWPEVEASADTICDAVLGPAAKFGQKPAVIEAETGETLTYAELTPRAEAVAAGLALAGFSPGDALAIALPGSIDFVLAWYGALLAGGWVVPINPLYTHAEMVYQIRDSGARFLLTGPDCSGAMEHEVEHLFVTGGNWNQILECRNARPDVRPKPDDIAALPYSSGTTGKPKGVMLTHANLVANVRQQSTTMARTDDVLVNIFPLFHIAGLNCVLNPFLSVGATIVMMRRFQLERYLELCEEYGATCLGAPPPVIVALTKSPLWNKFRLHRFSRALCGAAPLGSEAHEAFEVRTGLILGQIWGMTEASGAISAAPDSSSLRKHGACGYLLPSCEAQVVEVASQEPLGAGGLGEIWVRGPNIMQGYLNQPAANSETFTDTGWMRTGDIGYFDSDGCVYLVDRLKELIKYNAMQVAPAELEDVVQSHPAVLDAAVVGAPDAQAGEIPMAFVVRRERAALEANELMEYVAARVAPYKKIRAVEFVTEIPKSPAGKILRRVLKERLRTAAAAQA